MVVGYQQVFDVVFVFYFGGGFVFVIVMLCLVGGQWLGFGVVVVGDGYYVVFFGDQVGDGQVDLGSYDFGVVSIVEFGFDCFQFFMDYFYQVCWVGQDVD